MVSRLGGCVVSVVVDKRVRKKVGTLRYDDLTHQKLLDRAHSHRQSWNEHVVTFLEDLLSGRLCMVNPQGHVLRLQPDGSTPIEVARLEHASQGLRTGLSQY